MALASVTLRVTSVRSQNPHGFGGAIFTGVPVGSSGAVLDAKTYFVVKAPRSALGGAVVERGQWWTINGPLHERVAVVDGFELREQQVDAEGALLTRPSGEHIVTYLAENPVFEGIGAVKARRLWERFGERLLLLLDAGGVESLAEVLTPLIAQRLVDAWADHGETRTLQWLHAAGIPLALGRKVLRYFGDEAQARVEEDPYRLLSFDGKWSAVDQLARSKFGVSLDDPRRLRGAVEEACHRLFAAGHTAMLTADLLDRITPLLGKPPAGIRWRDLLATAVSEGLRNGSIVPTHHGVQPLGALVMERQVAKAIHERLACGTVKLLEPDEVDHLIAVGEAEDGFELNTEQRNALQLASQHAFVCITGGAGVGKTTVLRALYRLYDAAATRVLQVALAGRAAKRMQEATGRPASTIASFLRAVTEQTFEGPVVLVIDEASMVDIISMSRICQALPPHVRLVLVGDPHQLMPVGPGLVLHCVMQVPSIPVAELKIGRRFGDEIAAAAAAVRSGHWPDLSDDDTAPVAFIPCERSLIAETVLELYALDPEGTQVLAPLRNGPAGTKLLNQLCQQRLTSSRTAVTAWSPEHGATYACGLNLGDLVLFTRNLWDKGLQNGSLGRVVEVEPRVAESPDGEEQVIAWVEWDDGVVRALTVEMLEDTELGYGITVHKAQGSQWRRIVIPIVESRVLDRTLLYTAITRAQVQVIMVGDAQAAHRATLTPPKADSRQVGLDLLLRASLSDLTVNHALPM